MKNIVVLSWKMSTHRLELESKEKSDSNFLHNLNELRSRDTTCPCDLHETLDVIEFMFSCIRDDGELINFFFSSSRFFFS